MHSFQCCVYIFDFIYKLVLRAIICYHVRCSRSLFFLAQLALFTPFILFLRIPCFFAKTLFTERIVCYYGDDCVIPGGVLCFEEKRYFYYKKCYLSLFFLLFPLSYDYLLYSRVNECFEFVEKIRRAEYFFCYFCSINYFPF